MFYVLFGIFDVRCLMSDIRCKINQRQTRIQRSMSKCGEGLHTYSSPGNSEGADRLEIGKAHPMNLRNVILTVCRIGKKGAAYRNIISTVRSFAKCGAEKGRIQVLAGFLPTKAKIVTKPVARSKLKNMIHTVFFIGKEA